MDSLFNISEIFIDIFNQIDSLSDIEDESERADMEQAIIDTLDSVEQDFDKKIENCALYVKQLDADAEAIDNEMKSLRERKAAKEAKADRIRQYMIDSMQKVGKCKVDRPKASVTIRKGTDKVSISCSDADFIRWATENGKTELLEQKYSVSKTKLKPFIGQIDGIPAEIVNKPTLLVK